MHLAESYDSAEAVRKSATAAPPFGPGFTSEQAARAVRMEVWGTSFNDPGPDYCVFKLIGPCGNIIARKQIDGY